MGSAYFCPTICNVYAMPPEKIPRYRISTVQDSSAETEVVSRESERMSEYARKFFELYGETPIIGGSVSDEELDRMIAELDAELENKKNNPEVSETSSPENNSVISPDTTVDLPESDKPINLALILIPSAVGILLILGAVVGIKKKKP